MHYYLIKVLVTALIVIIASEIAQRSTIIGALIVSLPLTSILAITWLYSDTNSVEKIVSFSNSIFWAILPSLLFFIVLPLFLKSGMRFSIAIMLSISVMFVGYTVYTLIMSKFGVKI